MDLAGLWRYCPEDSPEFSQPEFADSAWNSMPIPQNWFLGGLDHHGVVWFRREFRLKRQAGKFATLHFDGVDYFADVYLNGVLLGRHTGYFEPFAFDISEALKPGKNVLAVRVDSPYETPGLDGWYLRKKLIKGVFNHHDCRPGGGWEPVGQSYNTGGIWNRVYVTQNGPVTIASVLLHADLESQPSALHADLTLHNREAKRRARLELRCDPENFQGKSYQTDFTIELPKGTSLHRLKLPVPDVARWNPWDRGQPDLYVVSLALEGVNFTNPFGFRSIRVDEGYNWFVNGERYFPRGSNYVASQWLAETLFPEANQGKDHPFGPQTLDGGRPSTVNRPWSWFSRDVNLARQANLNLLRVHAHVLPPEFHAACDRAGMLVWQDFPLQWGYTDEPDFQAEAVRQMRAMVRMLYNHPSIAAWCCHNEGPSDAPWMAGEAGALYDPAHNRELDQKLEQAARELDPQRYVHRNSGTGDGHVYPGWYFGQLRDFDSLPGAPFITEYGAQGLPARDDLLRTLTGCGPEAGYQALVSLKAWIDSTRQIKPSTKRLIRFGTAFWNLTERHPALKPVQNWMKGWGIKVERSVYKNLPALEATPEDLRPARRIWEEWCFHDFQPAETFDNGIEPGTSLDDFIFNSQSYQSRLLQYATERYRRNKICQQGERVEGKITGLVQFYFTDPWPAITWSVLDYWRVPKPAYEALRRSMQPVLPTFQLPDRLEAHQAVPAVFYAVNDLTQAFPRALGEWRLQNANGEIASATFRVNIPANCISTPQHVTLPSLVPGSYHLLASLTTTDGKLIGENLYEIHVHGPRKENLSEHPSA